MKLKINVTKDHIAKGTVSNGKKCPVALALKEVFKCAHVGRPNIRLSLTKAEVEVKTPARVVRFIDTFDTTLHRERMKPFSFEIDLTDELIKQVDISNLLNSLKV